MMMIFLGLTRRACRWTRRDPSTPFWAYSFSLHLNLCLLHGTITVYICIQSGVRTPWSIFAYLVANQ